MHSIHKLVALIESREDWLLQRLVEFSSGTGFFDSVTPLEAAWRKSVETTSRALVSYLHAHSADKGPASTSGPMDPRTEEFMVAEARKHQARGIPLQDFVGVLQIFGRAYKALVTEAGFSQEDERFLVECVERFFQSSLLSAVAAWTGASESEKARETNRQMLSLLEQKNVYVTAFEGQPYPVVLLGTNGRIRNVNLAAGRLLWDLYIPGSLLQEDLRFPPPPAWLERVVAAAAETAKGERVFREEIGTGSGLRSFEIKVMKLEDASNRNLGTVVSLHDITEQLQAERTMQQAHSHLRVVLEEFPNPVWISDNFGNCTYVNRSWTRLVGPPTTERGHINRLERVLKEDRERLRQHLDKSHMRRQAFEVEYRVLGAEGEQHWLVDCGRPLFDAQGRFAGFVGSCYDITERRQAAEKLEHQAYHDPLTGLPNRLLFQDRLSHCITRSRRRGRAMFAVLYLDMDRFKLINDTLGHQAGDRFLQEVAARLVRSVRGEDTVARMGGDEFAVLLEEVPDVQRVILVASRIQATLAEPWVNPRLEMATSASIGIALGSTGYANSEEVLRDADIAMYRAKARGRGLHEVFDPEMHNQLLERMELEADLRQSLDKNEMRLVFQPVVSLSDGIVRGFESLLRWQNGKRGLIPPDQFIPAAEECGFITKLGSWTLVEACRQAASWKTGMGIMAPFVTVNLSARQFSSGDLAKDVAAALEHSGLDPIRLRIEITESILLGEGPTVYSTLAAIKELGVKVYLDDFGTGYSSLSYLHRYPIDAVKVDRTFIHDLGDPRKASLVRAILDMARSMEMATVAEGIETKEQVDMLRAIGCPSGQGFYFSRPVSPEQVPVIIEAGKLPLPT